MANAPYSIHKQILANYAENKCGLAERKKNETVGGGRDKIVRKHQLQCKRKHSLKLTYIPYAPFPWAFISQKIFISVLFLKIDLHSFRPPTSEEHS